MSDRLYAGDKLFIGASIYSENGSKFRLKLQKDGNLVLSYRPENWHTWASRTADRKAKQAILQEDGNFILCNGESEDPLWETKTSGNPDAVLILGEDGNLVLFSNDRKPLWSTDTVWNRKHYSVTERYICQGSHTWMDAKGRDTSEEEAIRRMILNEEDQCRLLYSTKVSGREDRSVSVEEIQP